MARVDVVVVSYNSRGELRDCVEPLVGLPGVEVVVVDNSSSDGSPDTVSDLPLRIARLDDNRGFARGCNVGWRLGAAPAVLFLNPDARIDRPALERLLRILDDEPHVGVVGPRVLEDDGTLALSQRRFPRLRSTYAEALFLHRLFPHAAWATELVRDPGAYEGPARPEWISGACMLVRRPLLEELHGLDEGFLLYCEDKDLCRRVTDRGYEVRFEPEAVVRHRGGASAPRATLLPVLAASRVRYARKHSGRVAAFLERIGIGLGAFTHVLVARGGRRSRAGHASSLLYSLGLRPVPTLPGGRG
jgi:N-acetylglucosaminyl-diphospho-decaprenol L-rhamnosyltransferase